MRCSWMLHVYDTQVLLPTSRVLAILFYHLRDHVGLHHECRQIAWDDIDLIVVLDSRVVPRPYDGFVTNSPVCSSASTVAGRLRQ